MNEETVRLWQKKAENDFKTGSDELATEDPATDTVCFHMQQCVEKYLKSFLVYCGMEVSRTHNIALIFQSCKERDQAFESLDIAQIDRLTDYAVATRYPEDFYMPSIEEANTALGLADQVRRFVKSRTT